MAPRSLWKSVVAQGPASGSWCPGSTQCAGQGGQERLSEGAHLGQAEAASRRGLSALRAQAKRVEEAEGCGSFSRVRRWRWCSSRTVSGQEQVYKTQLLGDAGNSDDGDSFTSTNEHCRTEDLGPPEHCGTEDVCAWARTRTDSSSARGLVALSQGRLQAEPGGQGGQARALRVLGSWGRGCTGAHPPFSGNIFATSTRRIKRYGTENVQRPCRESLQGPKFYKPDPLLHGAAWRNWGATGLIRLPGLSSFCVTTIGLSIRMGTCLNTQNRKDLLSVLGVFQNLSLRRGLARAIKSWRGSQRLMSPFQGGG